jgi:hypothetical protein
MLKLSGSAYEVEPCDVSVGDILTGRSTRSDGADIET